MRFDVNLQLWVDENNIPLAEQPPIPDNTAIDGSLSGGTYDFNPSSTPTDFSINNNSNALNNFMGGLPGLGKPTDFSPINQALKTDVSYNNPNEAKKEQFNLFGDLANNIGKSYSLESSLYGLGYAMSPKDRTGMTEQQIKRDKTNNLVAGIGAGGKALVGGFRTFMSGMGAGKMDDWQTEEYKRKRREALVNNQQGVESAYAGVGGVRTYQDGGEQGDDVMMQLQQAVA